MLLVSFATRAAAGPDILAPGYRALEYPAPVAGSYTLDDLGPAADGALLDAAAERSSLHQAFGDGAVVLSFVYTTCRDGNGCPLASYVLSGLQRRLDADGELGERVRLVTLSFDPENDTPEVMRAYGERLDTGTADWRFYTTASRAELEPILEAYGQNAEREYGEDGGYLGTIAHVLRVYVIDADRRIRNIYSPSFLHEETVLADLRTVLSKPGSRPPSAQSASPGLPRAGDVRDGYEDPGYATRSQSLASRRGRDADLLAGLREPALGLPKPGFALPTAASVKLGRKLFFDRRLSHNDTISCAMCHVPEQGFTNNEMATPVGFEGRSVRRNAPSLYNVAYARNLFHDGRESELARQIWGPLLAANEMANPSVGYVIDQIADLEEYRALFTEAFGSPEPTMASLGHALADYQRTLVSGGSPFDRWRFAGEDDALTESAKRGYAIFAGRGECVGCHTVGEAYAEFTDHGFHDTGIGYRNSLPVRPAPLRVQIAPGTFVDVPAEIVREANAPRPSDIGRYEITGDPSDRWRYRTPGLRNVALTAPYMHDGSIPTLRGVVEFYRDGGVPHRGLDPAIHPLALTDEEVGDLVEFLESLTGDNVDALVADAFAEPVGDRR